MEEIYINKKGQYHRVDGPAITWTDGSQEWWINDKLHRDDGPEVTWSNGGQAWYINGERHRVDGPAVIHVDGTQEWCINGKYYRNDGLPYMLNKSKNTMTLANGKVVSMSADDYEKYQYKTTGRSTKAALRKN